MASFDLQFLSGLIHQDEISDPKKQDRYRGMLLENHRNNEPVLCHCCDQRARLSVVLSDTMFLRRYPGTAHLHHPDCMFAEEIQRPPSDADRSIPGVTLTDDGRIKLSVAADVFPLRKERREEQAQAADQGKEADKRERSGDSSGSITLLGIFRMLLDEAGMGEWKPSFRGLRTRQRFIRRLQSVAQRTVYGRGRCLNEIICWPIEPVNDEHLLSYFERSPVQGPRDEREILVVGELLNVKPSSTGKTVVIRVDWFRMLFLCEPSAWRDIEEQNGKAFSRDDQGDFKQRTWIMMTVRFRPTEEKKKPFFYVKACAAVMLSGDMIPVESSYELEAAERLVDAGRAFEKPLRYSKNDAMFPDFILRDTLPPTHFEVWGLSSDEYLKRRADKVSMCIQNRIPLLEWDAQASAPFPVLPAVSPYSGGNPIRS